MTTSPDSLTYPAEPFGVVGPTYPIVYATDFGVVADGATDDTAAMQAAINAMQVSTTEGERTLRLPAGRIMVNPLTISGQINMEGEGNASTVLMLQTGNTTPCITIKPAGTGPGAGAPFGDIILRKLRIESQSGKTGSTSAHGIQLKSGSWSAYVRFENVTVYAMSGDGINSGGFSGNLDCWACFLQNNGGYGVNANSVNDWHFYGGLIGVNTQDGVLLSGVSQFVFHGTNIYSNGTSNAHLFGAASTTSGGSFASFVGCMFDRGQQQGVIYDVRGQIGVQFVNCTFIDCSLSSPGTYSDFFVGSAANNLCSISNCIWGIAHSSNSNFSEKYALEFQGTSNSVTVDALNYFYGGTLSTNAAAGQVLLANVTSATIQSTQGLDISASAQFSGLTIDNGTNVIAKLSGISGSNDNGELQLLSGGSVIHQVSAGSGNASYFNSDVFLGNGGTNAAPSGRALRATDGSGTDISGAQMTISGGRPTGAGNGGAIVLRTTPPGTSGTTLQTEIERARIDQKGNFVVSLSALATNATDGFLYIPSCAGAPTGVPTGFTGRQPIVFDTTNNKLWIYNGAWKGVVVS